MRGLLLTLLTGAAIVGLAGCGPTCPTDESGIACVYAGTGTAGYNGEGKPARESRLYQPVSIAFAPDGTPWIADWNNHKVRTIDKDGTLSTRIGIAIPGDGDDDQNDLTPAGAPGNTVGLNHPTGVTFDPDGTVYVATWHNYKIRTCDPKTDVVHVIAGGNPDYTLGCTISATNHCGDGGPASNAGFNFPKDLVRLPDGSFYLLDQRNEVIRKLAADEGRTVSTVAGTGTAGFAGDGGDPTQAEFNWDKGVAPIPSGGIALAKDGKLYVADSLNNRIRVIDFAAKSVSTIAGTGVAGFAGDGGAAKAAKLNNPVGLAFGPDGRLYAADSGNGAIRAIDLKSGRIATVAGTGKPGTGAEGQEATKTALNTPWGVSFDSQGAMYVVDSLNNRILRVAP